MSEQAPQRDIDLSYDGETATDNVLPRARVDLEVTEQVYYGKPCYVIKDPTSLRYFRLRPPEYTIFQMLDGESTMEDVLRALAHRFPNDKYDAAAVMNFIVMLRGGNLLQVTGPNSTDYLLQRKKVLTRGFFTRLRTEFLFFRIPLLDPDRMLTWLHKQIGGLIFSRVLAWLTALVCIGAIVLLVQNIDKLGQRQPLLSWLNLLYMGVSFLGIKVIHEFGHGLTSKHFGSEVHEMGILFLVFSPCFYCDVSDAWMLPNKSKRMWITGAGILVEIVLAALATYVWALTEPKTLINQFALNVMIVASVNTLLFNGNPLLRYDGYYFLMDLVEIPNLRQKGSSYLNFLFQKHVLGLDNASEPVDVKGREFTVLSYALCATVYRWFISIAIISLVWSFLQPYGLGVIGAIMAAGAIYNFIFMPLGKFLKFLFAQRTRIHLRVATACILLATVVVSIYFILAIPIEQAVETQCVLRPAGMHPLYVTQPGFVTTEANEQFVQDGQVVEQGQPLLVLSDPVLENYVFDLQTQLEQLQTRRSYARQRGPAALADVAQLDAEIKAGQASLERAQANLEKLTIRAPVNGVVQLRTGKPLEKLVGRFLPVQTAVMAVYEQNRFEAITAVNHRDYSFVEPGQKVEVKLWPLDDKVFSGAIIEKPARPVTRMASAAFSTALGGEVPTMPAAEPAEALVPAENTFELAVPMPVDAAGLRDGMVGRAKIIVQERTLGRSVYLWLLRTLRQDIRL